MADIRLQMPDEVLANIQKNLGSKTKPNDIVRDAVTMYNWAVGEVANGRHILTANTAADDFAKLAMPSLQAIPQSR
jgi:hypothetical protein